MTTIISKVKEHVNNNRHTQKNVDEQKLKKIIKNCYMGFEKLWAKKF